MRTKQAQKSDEIHFSVSIVCVCVCVCGVLWPGEECVKQWVSSALSASAHWDRSQASASHLISTWLRMVCVSVCVEVRLAFQSLLNGHGVGSKQATEREEKRKSRTAQLSVTSAQMSL